MGGGFYALLLPVRAEEKQRTTEAQRAQREHREDSKEGVARVE
jgi:hypothetical protein